MFTEAFTLGAISIFVRDVLKALASDKLKQWTQTVPSNIKGRNAAFDLFQALERLTFLTDDFIATLRALEKSPESDGPEKEAQFYASVSEMHDTLRPLLAQFVVIDNIVRWSLTGALEIHRPELLRTINEMRFDRSQPLPVSNPFEDAFHSEGYANDMRAFITQGRPLLRERIAIAERNRADIQSATEEFRKFLATEYSFKESV